MGESYREGDVFVQRREPLVKPPKKLSGRVAAQFKRKTNRKPNTSFVALL